MSDEDEPRFRVIDGGGKPHKTRRKVTGLPIEPLPCPTCLQETGRVHNDYITTQAVYSDARGTQKRPREGKTDICLHCLARGTITPKLK